MNGLKRFLSISPNFCKKRNIQRAKPFFFQNKQYCSTSFDCDLRIFDRLVRVSSTCQFSDFPEMFRTIRSHVEISGILINQTDCGADFGKEGATSTFVYSFRLNYPSTKSENLKIRNVQTALSFAVQVQAPSATFFVE